MHKDNSILMITNTAGIKRYSTCQAAIKIFFEFFAYRVQFFPRKFPLDLFFQNIIYHIGAGHIKEWRAGMHLLKSKVSDPWGAEWTEKHLASEDGQG